MPIFLGTSFTIAHTISLISPAAKITKTLLIYLITELPFLTGDDVLFSVQSCLDLSGVDKLKTKATESCKDKTAAFNAVLAEW